MVSGPVRVLVELALLALSLDKVDKVVILLSVEDGETIILGRLDRLCKSFALFLCCGTLDGPVLALLALRENMLRTLGTALLWTESASVSGSGVTGVEYSWLSRGRHPGSSAGSAGNDGRERSGLMHVVGLSPEVAGVVSPKTASRFGADLTRTWFCSAESGLWLEI